MKRCDRCLEKRDDVRDGYKFTDDFGEEVTMSLCWDCDWEVSNGRDPFADLIDILDDREESELEY